MIALFIYYLVLLPWFLIFNLKGDRRLRQLESLFLGGPIQGQGQCFSIETLLDILLVLYDECCNSSLRREKTVSEFIEFGKFSVLFYVGCNIRLFVLNCAHFAP